MDVTLITNSLSIPRPNLNSNPSITGETDLLTNRNISRHFDYSDVMMDLKEVQDFLFMLIGSRSPGKALDTGKGTNVNVQA